MDAVHHLYAGKPETYFAGARDAEVADLLPAPVSRALELGCGGGATLARLKARGLVGWGAGIEISDAAPRCWTMSSPAMSRRWTMPRSPAIST